MADDKQTAPRLRTQGCWLKVVQSGPVVEVWKYGRPTLAGVVKGGRTAKASDRAEEIRESTARKARHQLMRKVNANHLPSETLFVTLTHAACIEDYTTSVSALQRWLRWLRKRVHDQWGVYPVWTAVAERQKRGAWHWHLLVSVSGVVPYLGASEVAAAWREGFVKVRRLEGETDNCGAYLSKYIAKSLETEERGRHSYRCSKGQVEPERIRNASAALAMAAVVAETGRLRCVRVYDSEYNGRIEYRQYNIGKAGRSSLASLEVAAAE